MLNEESFEAAWDDVQNMDLNDLQEFLRRGISKYLEHANEQSDYVPSEVRKIPAPYSDEIKSSTNLEHRPSSVCQCENCLRSLY